MKKNNLLIPQFSTLNDFFCKQKLIMEDFDLPDILKGRIEKRKKEEAEWEAPCLSVEELLCLQLLGYPSRQIVERVNPEVNERLKMTAAKASRELDKAKRILNRQAKAGVITIPYYAADYPYHFRNLCNDIPPLIHVLGNTALLNRDDTVTIIGARAADADGLDASYRFARQIGGQGHVVVSGLALGCDTAAHRGCLDADGQTVAIVASGLDITHPKVNWTLQEEIVAKGGVIVSEHPFGVKANPTRLVARCRMQVALTQSVIVAQCPIISGTMYAVRFAQEYDGDFFGWENDIYAVEYDTWDELNSGNKFLLDYNLALPIRPGQEVTLDNVNKIVIS